MLERLEGVLVPEEARHADEQVFVERVQLARIAAQLLDVHVDVDRPVESEAALDSARDRARLVVREVDGVLVPQEAQDGIDPVLFATAMFRVSVVARAGDLGQRQRDLLRRQDAIDVAVRMTVTLAGCLQHDAETGRFVLTNARLAQEQDGLVVRQGAETAPPAAGAPTTTGTVPPVLAGPRYFVDAPAGVSLQAHAGGQVQVTGSLEPDDADARPVGTTGTDAQADPRMEAGIDGRILANEVRLAADTCL